MNLQSCVQKFLRKEFWLFFFFLIFKILIKGWLLTILWSFLSNVNHKYTYVPSLLNPLPLPSPPHPSRLSQSTGFGFPVSYSKFPLASYFISSNVYVSMLSSQIVPHSSSPNVSKSLFFMSVSPLLSCK